MPRWRNPILPVALKPCPHCRGTGRVSKAGGRRDEFVAQSIEWAQGWHGKMVVVTLYNGRRFPGVAVAYIERGGWGALRVFTPKPIYAKSSRLGFSYPITYQDMRFPLPYHTVPKRNANSLELLEYWPDSEEVATLKRLPGLAALEAA